MQSIVFALKNGASPSDHNAPHALWMGWRVHKGGGISPAKTRYRQTWQRIEWAAQGNNAASLYGVGLTLSGLRVVGPRRMRRRAGRQAGNNMHNVGRLKCAERERKRAEWGGDRWDCCCWWRAVNMQTTCIIAWNCDAHLIIAVVCLLLFATHTNTLERMKMHSIVHQQQQQQQR